MTKEKRRKLREPQAVNNSGKNYYGEEWRTVSPPLAVCISTKYNELCTDAGRLYLRTNIERKEGKPMEECKNYFEAVLCNFNGENGYMLRQYVNGVLRVEQFVSNLLEWCKASGVPLETIAIID